MKGKWIFIILDLILALIVTVLVLAYTLPLGGVIASYIFLLVAIFAQLVPLAVNGKINELPYKYAMNVISGIYLILQLIVSLCGFSLMCSEKTALILGTVFLLIYAAALLIFFTAARSSDSIGVSDKVNAYFTDNIVQRLTVCRQNTSDNAIIDAISVAIDTAKFSNLKSPAQANELESKIRETTEKIENAVKGDRKSECSALCNELISLLRERETICKLYK